LKWAALMVVLSTGGLLIFATDDFPPWRDPHSPASEHVSPRYIEKSMEETGVPNLVTAVLADYRGYDTLFETAVIFTAGIACFLLLRTYREKEKESRLYRHVHTGLIVEVEAGSRMREASEHFERADRLWAPDDLIIRTACRILIPFIQLFGLQVLANGHHTPGGGFQGGVILGASLILLALSRDLRTATRMMPERISGLLSASGVLVYAGIGTVCVLLGHSFLDYAALAPILFVDPVQARNLGILGVEIGVAMAVMATMIVIYGNVASAGYYDEGL